MWPVMHVGKPTSPTPTPPPPRRTEWQTGVKTLAIKHSSGCIPPTFVVAGPRWVYPNPSDILPLLWMPYPHKEHGTRDTLPPRNDMGPGRDRTPSPGRPPVDRPLPPDADPSPYGQTPVKTLPCPKLRLRAVKWGDKAEAEQNIAVLFKKMVLVASFRVIIIWYSCRLNLPQIGD